MARNEQLFLIQGSETLPGSGKLIGRIYTVYATSEQHALEKARGILSAHPGLTDIKVEACPSGFMLGQSGLPGRREAVRAHRRRSPTLVSRPRRGASRPVPRACRSDARAAARR